jgi:DNA-binding YbaB/EbfC family protein
MFKQIGQIASLMSNLPKIRAEMEQLQERLGQLTAEGDAGAGIVKVVVNGRLEMQSCRLSDDALRSNDREMLEDLIRAATNQAVAKVRQQISEETAKTASGLGLPPGLNLPGLG